MLRAATGGGLGSTHPLSRPVRVSSLGRGRTTGGWRYATRGGEILTLS